ncbi:MAG TPA: hypothetical protein VJ327_01830 [Patescibacteria group bacterium]|nr:hypothetical protein [Patescibacteria group bacterium]
MKEIWVVERNFEPRDDGEHAWHVDTLEAACKDNLKAAALEQYKFCTWAIVGYTETQKEASELCERLRRIMHE